MLTWHIVNDIDAFVSGAETAWKAAQLTIGIVCTRHIWCPDFVYLQLGLAVQVGWTASPSRMDKFWDFS